MTSAELLALAAFALFFAVSLWLGLTQRQPRRAAAAPGHPAALLDRAAFTRRSLLTAEEGRLYAALDAHLASRGDGHRALPQAPLAALLELLPSGHQARDTAATAAIAARRLDIAILDPRGHLAVAVSLHGPDAVTRAALQRAGIPLVTATEGGATLDQRLDTVLGPVQLTA